MIDIKNDRWAIAIALAISIAFVIPFAIHNVNFVDDWLRADVGTTSWEGNGRPASSVIMAIFSLSPFNFFGDGVLADIFPFNLFASSVAMVFSGYLICKMIGIRSMAISTLIMIAPVVNPYWIGNISFRFDSLVMSAAFLSAVVSVYLSMAGNIRAFILSIASTVLMLCLYQAAINVMVSLAIVISVAQAHRDGFFKVKKSALLHSLIIIIISYIIYNVFIYRSLDISEYTKTSGEIIHINSDALKLITLNMYELSASVLSLPGKLVAFFICIIVAASVYFSFKISTGGPLSKLAFTIAPLFIFILSFGLLALLKSPALSSRVYLSFCFVIIYFLFCADKTNYKASWITVPFFILSFSLSSIVSNAMSDVQRYDRFVAERIANKLYDLGYKNGDGLFIAGRAGTPALVSRSFKSIPMTSEMSVSSFANLRFKYSLMRQYNINSPTPELSEAIRETNQCVKNKIVVHDDLLSICKSESGYSVLIRRI